MANVAATLTVFTLAWLATANLPAAAQQPVPPAAAAPMPPGIFVSGERVTELLKTAIAGAADPAVAEVGVSDQYAIHEVHRSKGGPAAIHLGWTELHYVVNGGGTLVTGGTMTKAAGGNTIEGGVSHTLKKGDAFIIPPNTPHMYTQVDGTLTYLEVRFVTAPSAAAK